MTLEEQISNLTGLSLDRAKRIVKQLTFAQHQQLLEAFKNDNKRRVTRITKLVESVLNELDNPFNPVQSMGPSTDVQDQDYDDQQDTETEQNVENQDKNNPSTVAQQTQPDMAKATQTGNIPQAAPANQSMNKDMAQDSWFKNSQMPKFSSGDNVQVSDNQGNPIRAKVQNPNVSTDMMSVKTLKGELLDVPKTGINAKKLSQPTTQVGENASGGATGTGGIAAAPMPMGKKKTRTKDNLLGRKRKN